MSNLFQFSGNKRRPWWRDLHIGRRELGIASLAGLLIGVAVAQFGWPDPSSAQSASAPGRTISASRENIQFGLCYVGGGANCVVDGDTIWMEGVKIRIADIDTPETHPPRCAAEADLGNRATRRLQALLNEGPIALVPIERDEDRYGRKLRRIMRGGKSLGEILVAEGLARPYRGGPRPGWCD